LRARRSDTSALASLRALPDAELFEAMANGQLARRGQRVPVSHAPHGTWRPLAELLPIELPASRLPADPAAVQPLPLRPVPAHRARPADALLTTLRELAAFAASAPLVRLARLQFAADSRGDALVLGTPLPALPGLPLLPRGATGAAVRLRPAAAARRRGRRRAPRRAAARARAVARRRPPPARARRGDPAVHARGARREPEGRPWLKCRHIRPATSRPDRARSGGGTRTPTAVTFDTGTPTIALREELALVIEALRLAGLPRFDLVVTVLAATTEAGRRELKLTDLPAIFRTARDPATKASLVQVLASRRTELAGTAAAATADRLRGSDAPHGAHQHRDSWVLREARAWLRSRIAALGEQLELAVRTGMSAVPEPAALDLPHATRALRLLDELDRDALLATTAARARRLLAAWRPLRGRLGEPQVAAITPAGLSLRGPLDRLLLSELAHDPDVLLARLALGEALARRARRPHARAERGAARAGRRRLARARPAARVRRRDRLGRHRGATARPRRAHAACSPHDRSCQSSTSRRARAWSAC
jgi:hypothetical protein